MCKRCDTSRKGYILVLDVRDVIALPDTDQLWVRVLWPEEPTAYPRYLVENSGRIVAIQEPDCPHWHIRTIADVLDVNDSTPPVTGKFDRFICDEGGTFQFDTADHTGHKTSKHIP